ncbi:MAG: DUF2147 domain-containing protein [Actinomycetota bacterium]
MLAAAMSPPAFAADPRGTWLTQDKDAALTIAPCGTKLCGRIIWLQSARDRGGGLRRDDNNPDPGKQSQRICGLVVIQGLEPSGPNTWAGSVYNPEDGKTYHGTVTVLSNDALRVRAYLALPIFSKNQTWMRVSGADAHRLDYNCRNRG